jgi:hypothetical protein
MGNWADPSILKDGDNDHATIALPRRKQCQVLLDGKPTAATAAGPTLNVVVPPGRHVLESR